MNKKRPITSAKSFAMQDSAFEGCVSCKVEARLLTTGGPEAYNLLKSSYWSYCNLESALC